jgi:hypothetical protein
MGFVAHSSVMDNEPFNSDVQLFLKDQQSKEKPSRVTKNELSMTRSSKPAQTAAA